MKRKRNIKTYLYLLLRHCGMLCRKPGKITRRIRVAKTIHPDGSTTHYDEYLAKIPENKFSLQSEVGAFLATKKLSKPNCKFDITLQLCSCGKNLNEFVNTACNNKK